jgi:hypothetical protein
LLIRIAWAGQWNSAENIFEVSLDHFQSSTTINITSVYAAAQEAVKGWKELPQSSKNTFILTGNCANVTPLPVLMTLTVGKSGSASLMEMAAKSYKDKGYR